MPSKLYTWDILDKDGVKIYEDIRHVRDFCVNLGISYNSLQTTSQTNIGLFVNTPQKYITRIKKNQGVGNSMDGN